MTQLPTLALVTGAFATTGWCATLLSTHLCKGHTPFEDGPAPVHFARWTFAAAAGCLGLALALRAVPAPLLYVGLFAVFTLATCAAADLSSGILPDAVTLLPLALVLGGSLVLRTWAPLLGATLIAAPFALLALYSRGYGMGWGDVKLAALGGALLGVREAALAFIIAAFMAYGVARVARGADRPFAFGPYLAASIATAFAVQGVI